MNSDFLVSWHGTVVLLHAQTSAAEEWVDQHLPPDVQTWGDAAVVVEPRYIGAIIDGIRADGLEVRS